MIHEITKLSKYFQYIRNPITISNEMLYFWTDILFIESEQNYKDVYLQQNILFELIIQNLRIVKNVAGGVTCVKMAPGR